MNVANFMARFSDAKFYLIMILVAFNWLIPFFFRIFVFMSISKIIL
jgi:hypothetical protein